MFWNTICAMYFSRIWKWQCQSLLMVQYYLGKHRQLQAEKNYKQKSLRILSVWAKKWQMKFKEGQCRVVHMGRNHPNFTFEMKTPELLQQLSQVVV